MNPLHLLWIVPVSMLIGAAGMAFETTCYMCPEEEYYDD